MPSNLSSQFKFVLDQFTPDILGLIWITDSELSRDLQGFDQFNYLFDGLISYYLFSLGKSNLPQANIFFTMNFNQKIFLSHLINSGDISGQLDEQVAIAKSQNDQRTKILVLSKVSRDWRAELQKRYPHFEFIPLDLDK